MVFVRKVFIVVFLVSFCFGVIGCGAEDKGAPPPAGFDPNKTAGLASSPPDIVDAPAQGTPSPETATQSGS